MKKITLGALLHDIGKFYQRTGTAISSGLSLKYSHAEYTSEFFKKYEKLFLEHVENISDIARLAAMHHNPDSPETWIISKADMYSAGMERKSDEEENQEQGPRQFLKKRLIPVFRLVNIEGGNRAPESFYELRPMAPDMGVFPVPADKLNPPRDTTLEKQYGELWKAFITELEAVKASNSDQFINTLIWLLEKYTWSIPSTTIDRPDISLFDHSATTAAISAAMYHFHREKPDETSIRDNETEKFMFIVGDLSGIQPFIFNMGSGRSRGAARLLRARSFYIAAITDIVSHTILRELQLPPCSIIMGSGGRFVILAQNTRQAREAVSRLRGEVDREMYARFNGALSLNISAEVTARGSDFTEGRFAKILTRISESAEKSKSLRFSHVFRHNGEWRPENFVMDINQAEFSAHGKCPLCEKYAGIHAAKEHGEGESEFFICNHCNEMVKVGRMLPRAEKVCFRSDGKGAIRLLDNGISLDLESKDPNIYYRICSLNSGTAGSDFLRLANHVPRYGDGDISTLRELGVDGYKDAQKGDAMPFNHIADLSREPGPDSRPLGRSMLGALKADVDNLGMIFSRGLKNDVSISRYKAMSRMLDYFFTVYLQQLIRSKYPLIYTVFAGGDDLFIIGPWDQAVRLALDMQEKFHEYTALNKNITVSAGISVVRPRLPVRKIGEYAEHFLDASKNAGKDSVTVFGITMPWKDAHDQFNNGEYLCLKIRENIEKHDKGINIALAYRLMSYADRQDAFKKGDVNALMYKSHMTYDFERNIVKRNKEDGKQIRERLQEMLCTDDKSLKGFLRFPLTYAIYKNRR
ncbi:MAG: type III-A CRISPR-associated protein Cas10/Csm1 [bacterium]